MKKLIYTFAVVLVAVSCNLEEINENPNVPNQVPLSTLLPPTQKTIADVQGGQLFRINNIFSQHMEGDDDRPLDFERYNPSELFIGNSWNDLYTSSIINLKIIAERANEEGSPHYAGVAKVLLAQALGLLTDTWGNVPFREAAQGAQAINPAYDDQELIYNEIHRLLDEAMIELKLEESIFTPGSDDIIYNGNLQNWIAAANMLKARYLMHTTKRNQEASTEALMFLMEGFNSSSDDLEYPYLGTGEDINPINGYFAGTDFMVIDEQFLGLMESSDDPRIDFAFKILPSPEV